MIHQFRIKPSSAFHVFAQDAFEGVVGKTIPYHPGTLAKVLGARVSEDGTYAEFLMEIPDDSEAARMILGY